MRRVDLKVVLVDMMMTEGTARNEVTLPPKKTYPLLSVSMQATSTAMTKTVRARFTLEFEQEAVRLVTGAQSIAAAARSLGVVEQTLFNWV